MMWTFSHGLYLMHPENVYLKESVSLTYPAQAAGRWFSFHLMTCSRDEHRAQSKAEKNYVHLNMWKDCLWLSVALFPLHWLDCTSRTMHSLTKGHEEQSCSALLSRSVYIQHTPTHTKIPSILHQASSSTGNVIKKKPGNPTVRTPSLAIKGGSLVLGTPGIL